MHVITPWIVDFGMADNGPSKIKKALAQMPEGWPLENKNKLGDPQQFMMENGHLRRGGYNKSVIFINDQVFDSIVDAREYLRIFLDRNELNKPITAPFREVIIDLFNRDRIARGKLQIDCAKVVIIKRNQPLISGGTKIIRSFAIFDRNGVKYPLNITKALKSVAVDAITE